VTSRLTARRPLLSFFVDAPVQHTSARIAIPPICGGHLERRHLRRRGSVLLRRRRTAAIRRQTFVQRSIGGVAEGSREDREKRYGPTQNAAMRCRPETPNSKRCAVARKKTVRWDECGARKKSLRGSQRNKSWRFFLRTPPAETISKGTFASTAQAVHVCAGKRKLRKAWLAGVHGLRVRYARHFKRTRGSWAAWS
jgi:hypothetical protein